MTIRLTWYELFEFKHELVGTLTSVFNFSTSASDFWQINPRVSYSFDSAGYARAVEITLVHVSTNRAIYYISLHCSPEVPVCSQLIRTHITATSTFAPGVKNSTPSTRESIAKAIKRSSD